MLAAVPAGFLKVDPPHTDDVKGGDRIYIEFPFGSGGYFLFGSSEMFTVSKSIPGEGVWFVGEDGQQPSQIPMPIKGTYDQLVNALKDKTPVNLVEVYRPSTPDNLPGADKLAGFSQVPWTSTIVPGMLVVQRMQDGWWVTRIDSVAPEASQGSYELKVIVQAVPASMASGRQIGDSYVYSTTDLTRPGSTWSLWSPAIMALSSGFPWMTALLAVGGLAGVAIIVYIIINDRK